MNVYLNKKDQTVVKRFLKKHFPDGEVTAQELLELAKSRRSEIHKYFEWDDTVAAQKWRLRQARELIRSVRVEIEGVEAPAYVNVTIERDKKKHRTYMSTRQARQNADIWQQVVMRALEDAESWSKRYENLRELSPIHRTIKEVSRKVERRNKSKGRKA